jgi:outer membrane biosynthesis protein TonB
VKGREASSAALAGTLINRSTHNDVLTMVSLTDDAPGSPLVTLSPNISLAAGQLLPLGAENHQPLTVPDARGIVVGDFVDVVLHFRDAGDLHLQVAAADRDRFYSELVPAGPTAPPAQADVPGRGAYGKAGPPAKPEPAAATGKPGAAAPASSTAAHKPGKPAEPAATKAPKSPEKPEKPAPTKSPAKSAAPAAQPAKSAAPAAQPAKPAPHTESTQPSQAAAQPATTANSAGGAQSVAGPAKSDGAAARPH